MNQETTVKKIHQIINTSLELIDEFIFEIELDDHDRFFRYNMKRIRKNLIKLRDFLISNESKKYFAKINYRLNILMKEILLYDFDESIELLIKFQKSLSELKIYI